MLLSKTTDYAIQIMIEVAKNKGIVSSTNISEHTGISQKYLKKVALQLKETGLLKSISGHYGGYVLAKPAEEITVWDIISSMEADVLVSSISDKTNNTVEKIHNEINELMKFHFSEISLWKMVEWEMILK